MRSVEIVAVAGLPTVNPGDDLPGLLAEAITRAEVRLQTSDVVAVCQKVVSKAEGAIVRLGEVTPSAFAAQVAEATGKDPRVVEVVLREARRIVRMDRRLIICETRHGWVCANAGVDESNALMPDTVTLLPRDPDASARAIRAGLGKRLGVEPAVVVTDTFGRPWREGLVEVALGVAGIEPLLDLRGGSDLAGRQLRHTVIALADEIAAAAGLVMEKGGGVGAAVLKGVVCPPGEGRGARALVRRPELDLFR